MVLAFTEVIEWMQATFPECWPETERAALVEEAKGALRRDPEGGGEWYLLTAQTIRETGWWT